MGSIQNNKEPQTLGPMFIIHLIWNLLGVVMAKNIELHITILCRMPMQA